YPSIWPNGDETARCIPRRQRPATAGGEDDHAPREDREPEAKRNEADPSDARWPCRRTDDEPRDDYRRNAGKHDHGDERPKNDHSRGVLWQGGQWKVPRPPTTVRTIARPQRGHGSPARERLLPGRGGQRPTASGAGGQSPPTVERRRINDRHASELARVGEAQSGPVLESDFPADVPLVHVGRSVQQLACHAERDDEGLATVEIEHHELATSAHVADAAPAQPRAHHLGRL